MTKGKRTKGEQRCTKHTHKAEYLVTQTPLKQGLNPGAPYTCFDHESR